MKLTKSALMLAILALQDYYDKPFDSKELANIVVQHAAACGAAAAAAGVLPGAGSAVASVIAVGAIWTMYIRIGSFLNLKLGKDALKALASAVLANIVTQLAGLFALEFVLSFIPGANMLAVGIINFGVTYLAGLIYIKTLTGIFAAGCRVDSLTSDQLKAHMNSAAATVDAKAVFNEAKATYKEMKKDGSLDRASASVQLEEDAISG